MSTHSGSLGVRHARRVSIVAPHRIQIPSFDSRVIREITHLATDNILPVSDVGPATTTRPFVRAPCLVQVSAL